MENTGCQWTKENPERPRNPSLVIFNITQFLRVSFQLKCSSGNLRELF